MKDKFPPLKAPPKEVQDSGVLRYGDGFITAQYPQRPPVERK